MNYTEEEDMNEDTDIICKIKNNEEYFLMLLKKSNYFCINSVFRSGKNNDLFYKTTKYQSTVFTDFIMRFYNTCFPDTAEFCIIRKFRILYCKETRDDTFIKPFNSKIFYQTKDDTFIFKHPRDNTGYYCDYCCNIE
jgi:hypothetical protein